MYSNGIQSYRKTNVITADPVRLVIMCYEGAIDGLKLAKQKLIDKDKSVLNNPGIKLYLYKYKERFGFTSISFDDWQPVQSGQQKLFTNI